MGLSHVSPTSPHFGYLSSQIKGTVIHVTKVDKVTWGMDSGVYADAETCAKLQNDLACWQPIPVLQNQPE